MSEERGVNKTCDHCGGPLHFVKTQARCTDKQCPLYWQGQGGIETLTPNPPTSPTERESMPIQIRKPS